MAQGWASDDGLDVSIRSESIPVSYGAAPRRRYRANLLKLIDSGSHPSYLGISDRNIDEPRLPGASQWIYHLVLLENPESQPAFSMEQAPRDLLAVSSDMVQEKFEKTLLKPGERGVGYWLLWRHSHHEGVFVLSTGFDSPVRPFLADDEVIEDQKLPFLEEC